MKRILIALGFLVADIGTAQAQGYTMIVNVANAVSSVDKDEIVNLFLKRSFKWSNGTAALPVNQEKVSKVREAFTRGVIGRSPAAVESYWQQQIFAGKEVPPAEKGSDADVIAFVKAHPGAVGYVTAGLALPADVKALSLKDL